MKGTIHFATFGSEFSGRIINLQVNGHLKRESYRSFVPALERLIEEHGKIRLLLDLSQFEGWSLGGSWQDLLFGFKHHRDVERIALVGDRKWEFFMSGMGVLFSTSEVSHFDAMDKSEAVKWLKDEVEPPSSGCGRSARLKYATASDNPLSKERNKVCCSASKK